MEFIEKQLLRKSERGLDPKRDIPLEIIKKFKDIISASPTSINAQNASAIFIQNKKMIAKIADWNWNQTHICNAPLIILFLGDMQRIKYAFEKNGMPDWELDDSNFSELLLVGAVDATIKSQAIVDAALSLDLGSCYIGGIRTFSDKLIQELNLPEFVIPIVALTVGYIQEEEGIKPKLNVVFDEKYDMHQMKNEVDKYDNVMNKYYKTRTINSKDINWSQNTSFSYRAFFNKNYYAAQDKLIKRKYKTKK